MNSYNICAKKTHGAKSKIKEHCALESLALWLISTLSVHVVHQDTLQKTTLLNAALDIIKKYNMI